MARDELADAGFFPQIAPPHASSGFFSLEGDVRGSCLPEWKLAFLRAKLESQMYPDNSDAKEKLKAMEAVPTGP